MAGTTTVLFSCDLGKKKFWLISTLKKNGRKKRKRERLRSDSLMDGKKMGVRILVDVFRRYYGFVGIPGGWAVFVRVMSVFVSVIVRCRTCLTWVSVYV